MISSPCSSAVWLFCFRFRSRNHVKAPIPMTAAAPTEPAIPPTAPGDRPPLSSSGAAVVSPTSSRPGEDGSAAGSDAVDCADPDVLEVSCSSSSSPTWFAPPVEVGFGDAKSKRSVPSRQQSPLSKSLLQQYCSGAHCFTCTQLLRQTTQSKLATRKKN